MDAHTQMFVVLNERGAIFGPFMSVVEATSFADKACGVENAWRIARVIRPTKSHMS